MQGRITLVVYPIRTYQWLVAEVTADIRVAARCCQMQGRALKVSARLNIDAFFNECLEDITVAFVCSIVQSCPRICTFSVHVGDLEQFFCRVNHLHHLLHVSFFCG